MDVHMDKDSTTQNSHGHAHILRAWVEKTDRLSVSQKQQWNTCVQCQYGYIYMKYYIHSIYIYIGYPGHYSWREGSYICTCTVIGAILLCLHSRYTVMLIEIAHFSVGKLLLHHYRRNLAHISDRCSSVIELYLSEIWAKNNWKTND